MTELRGDLEKLLSASRVLTSALELAAWAGDASLYRIVPQAVVFPESLEEVRGILEWSRRKRVPLTFRAAGTSLSGQAVGDGVLVCVTRGWRKCESLEAGAAVRLGPGLIAERANRLLRPFARKIGPDPASIDSCMIGGVLANNSSGMCCGTNENAYRSLRGLRFVLASGVVIDTRQKNASELFAREEPGLHAELLAIRDEIRADSGLESRIRGKYRIKNTMGYSLNAFLDFDDPVEILSHLMIGSEGTLGFIAEADLATYPLDPYKATALLEFDSLESACISVAKFSSSGARAIELMDGQALRGVPGRAALLVEYAFASAAQREARLPELEKVVGLALSCDPDEQEKHWKARKGALPRIGANRAPGTTVIIEDVAVPVEHLASCARELREILDRRGYREGALFGHAKDGNLHFVIAQGFESAEQTQQYQALMEDVVACVIGRHGGSLKAEHGTGRNMAPFVELEWGKEAYALMRRVKRAADPLGILNPGVLLNDDPKVHLKNIKTLPGIDEESDRCMECGFCEPRCPSRELTLSPRQRIAVRRAMARGSDCSEKEYAYAVLDTCAADGACAELCPVGIDTGAVVKRLRSDRRSAFARAIARIVRKCAGWVERLIPWARLRKTHRPAQVDFVYFPSCVNRWSGARVSDAAARVMHRAGQELWIPAEAQGQCCGLAFRSKGFAEEGDRALNRLIESVHEWTDGGRIPVLVDSSPCALSLKSTLEQKGLKIRALDTIEAAEAILPNLKIGRKIQSALLHPVCSVEKMKLRGAMERVARACAENVRTPETAQCCGFAGDKGFFLPELTRSATRAQAAEISALPECSAYSTSTTCEIAMRRATGRKYSSLWNLLDEASKSSNSCGYEK